MFGIQDIVPYYYLLFNFFKFLRFHKIHNNYTRSKSYHRKLQRQRCKNLVQGQFVARPNVAFLNVARPNVARPNVTPRGLK
jgi:hypothetical protein